MRRRTLVMFVIATLAVGLGWQATASAGNGYGNDPGHKPYGPHAPYITTSSSTVDPGDSITINCRNFAPHELVVFKVDGGRHRQDLYRQAWLVLDQGDRSQEHDAGVLHHRGYREHR